jgi:hypothetical protein
MQECIYELYCVSKNHYILKLFFAVLQECDTREVIVIPTLALSQRLGKKMSTYNQTEVSRWQLGNQCCSTFSSLKNPFD